MGEALGTVVFMLVVIIAIFCVGVFIVAILDKKEEEDKKREAEEKKREEEEEKREEEKKVPTESASTPAEPKEQSAEDEREVLKREIIAELKGEELKGEDPKAQSNAKKPPVLAIVAICLLGAHILGQLRGTLELTGGVFDAGVMGYTIGALAFAIAALVLMIVDTVKRSKK